MVQIDYHEIFHTFTEDFNTHFFVLLRNPKNYHSKIKMKWRYGFGPVKQLSIKFQRTVRDFILLFSLTLCIVLCVINVIFISIV